MNTLCYYPWKRFWCPKGGHYRLDIDGYLLDPGSKNIFGLTDVYTRPDEKPCVALLGEPGIGKTQALCDYKISRLGEIGAGPNDLMYLNLRSYSSDARLYHDIFESPKWLEWLDGTHALELILDSLDECMIHVKTVAAMLTDGFRKYPVSRLHLRIACRTAEWPKLLDDELPQIWGQENFGIYELLPLRRVDVEIAAKAEGIDAPELLEVIRKRDMAPFAIKPITLRMLMQDFKKKGALTGNQTDLYRNYLLHLCREPSQSRHASGVRGRLIPEQKLAIAERIAALTIFSKRAAIYEGPDERDLRPDEDLEIKDLAGGEEAAGSLIFDVTPENIEEVLRATGLFTSGIGDRLVWSHWTYAEFLAAMYLVRHGVTDEQATDLLFHPHPVTSNGRSLLVPQLEETAAWLAINRRSLFDKIMRSDPKALLKSPVANTDYGQRRALIESLLRLAEAGEITDMEIGMRLRYELLCHPEIADQLRPYIIDKEMRFLARRMAIDIAEACKVTALTDALIQVASDHTENTQERIEAAHALTEIGSPDLPNLLRQLLEETENDDQDELKGIALRALWPDYMKTEELFTYITTPKRENFHGMYALFIGHELASQLRPADLPVALAWVRRQPSDYASSFLLSELSANILQRSWYYLDDVNVLSAFAETILHRLRNYDPVLGSKVGGKEEPSKLLDDTEKRRRLVEAAISKFADSDDALSLTISSDLVRDDDLFWLIRSLESCKPESEQRVWAKLIYAAFQWGSVDRTEALLLARERNEVLKIETAPLFDAIELDSSGS